MWVFKIVFTVTLYICCLIKFLVCCFHSGQHSSKPRPKISLLQYVLMKCLKYLKRVYRRSTSSVNDALDWFWILVFKSVDLCHIRNSTQIKRLEKKTLETLGGQLNEISQRRLYATCVTETVIMHYPIIAVLTYNRSCVLSVQIEVNRDPRANRPFYNRPLGEYSSFLHCSSHPMFKSIRRLHWKEEKHRFNVWLKRDKASRHWVVNLT